MQTTVAPEPAALNLLALVGVPALETPVITKLAPVAEGLSDMKSTD